MSKALDNTSKEDLLASWAEDRFGAAISENLQNVQDIVKTKTGSSFSTPNLYLFKFKDAYSSLLFNVNLGIQMRDDPKARDAHLVSIREVGKEIQERLATRSVTLAPQTDEERAQNMDDEEFFTDRASYEFLRRFGPFLDPPVDMDGKKLTRL